MRYFPLMTLPALNMPLPFVPDSSSIGGEFAESLAFPSLLLGWAQPFHATSSLPPTTRSWRAHVAMSH